MFNEDLLSGLFKGPAAVRVVDGGDPEVIVIAIPDSDFSVDERDTPGSSHALQTLEAFPSPPIIPPSRITV